MKLNITKSYLLLLLLPLALGGLEGCVGTQTFTTAARQGETVSLAIGRHHLARQNLTVTIKDSKGVKTVYAPNDVRVRGVINLYPDPASKAVVSDLAQTDFGDNESVTGANISVLIGADRDWWQTVMLLDMPAVLNTGIAQVSIEDSAGASILPATIEILPGTSSSNLFSVYNQLGAPLKIATDFGGLNLVRTFERADVSTVMFNGLKDANGKDIIPHSIQVEFTHTPGIGKAWVVNPKGDMKNVTWSDDGTKLIVMVTPNNGLTARKNLTFISQKFYITGGITGLSQPTVKAYDINGTLMTGVTATVTPQ
ncbi:hypothetical protein [Sulfurirhabdus autotrophica]|uniref:DUF4382 domain-containing protein n=1 Tax=Sulfurirhabdus autotrophica TaxID=1706046 RepID=A0A4R3XP80_9PROT|nr:hypothetical protein [Sulfurirhabdus autotrophica]TCV77433.1 hypothetical protein EDC63_1581 [Sulfurirhabdus autotrophica]